MEIWKVNFSLKIRYLINNAYNYYFIRKNKIKDASNVGSSQTVWLLNIDRMIKKSGLKSRLPIFTFMDVGCGKGIACIYTRQKFYFSNVTGFDNNKKILRAAFKNDKAHYYGYANAQTIVLPPKRYFLFLFNPFDAGTMFDFLHNNISMLNRTGSVMAYANCKHLDTIKKFEYKRIVEIKKYKCAVIFF